MGFLSCSVPFCQTRGYTGFSRVPSDPHLRAEWLRVLGLPQDDSKQLRICANHFSKEDYDCDSAKLRLKKYAVPHLNISGMNAIVIETNPLEAGVVIGSPPCLDQPVPLTNTAKSTTSTTNHALRIGQLSNGCRDFFFRARI